MSAFPPNESMWSFCPMNSQCPASPAWKQWILIPDLRSGCQKPSWILRRAPSQPHGAQPGPTILLHKDSLHLELSFFTLDHQNFNPLPSYLRACPTFQLCLGPLSPHASPLWRSLSSSQDSHPLPCAGLPGEEPPSAFEPLWPGPS